MPNPGGFGELGFNQAALKIESALRRHCPEQWRRLRPEELSALYFARQFVRGWRIAIPFSDGIERSIDILVRPNFPEGYPRTALVDGPGQLVWPHVEYDGVLCLLPALAEVDAEQPGEVAMHLLSRSARLIEELLRGSIIDRDFREEFLTYWGYAIDSREEVHSLLEPRGPSRQICVFRGENMVIVGEDKDKLERWLTNRFGKPRGRKMRILELGVLLWLDQPPLPSAYPATGADLLALAADPGDHAQELLVEAAGKLPTELTVLIGAEGRGGPGLVAATTAVRGKALHRHGRVEEPFLKGFSKSRMPKEVAAFRTFSSAPVIKTNVQRADPAWIHGRGKDQRTSTLLGKTIVLIGCGSIGSSLAALLARAGIGVLHIVDPERLTWANVGRHELGAESVGKSKALQMAALLQARYPHLTIVGHEVSAQALINGYGQLLASCDLILSATGSWDAEGALNRWHVAEQRRLPIVYGWTETLAAAGHAVLIGEEGGCLRCGIGATGAALFAATAWRDDLATLEEPACGNHFMPYGAVELSATINLIAETALDALLVPPGQSTERLWLSPIKRVEAAGGTWSDALRVEFSGSLDGGVRLERPWPFRACPACGTDSRAAAA